MIDAVFRRLRDDRERIQRISKEGGWIVVGQVVSVAGMLALVRVLTEFLTPPQYGQLALGLTVSALVAQVVMGGISSGVGRFYSIASESNDLYGYFKDSTRLMAYATAIVVVIAVVIVMALYWLGYSKWVGLAIVVVAFSILNGYNACLKGIQNAARQRAIVAIHDGLSAWLKIGLAVGALLLFGVSSVTVVVGYVFAMLLVTLSQRYFLQRTILNNALLPIQKKYWKRELWRYSWPFSLFGMFTWMQQVSDRWSLQAFATTEDVGRYAVVFQLGYAPTAVLLGMAMTFIGPILYQRSGDVSDEVRNKNVHHLSRTITFFSLMVTTILFFVTFVLHEWIFGLLVATEYREISYLLPWVVLAGGIFSSAQMISLKLMSEMKTKDLIAPKVITAMFGVVFNVVGSSIAGVHGVVIALIGFSTVYFIWMLLLGYHLTFNINRFVNKN